MPVFSDNNISVASVTDAVAITSLLNLAYRGEGSRKGWTTEAGLISGDQRTNVQEVQRLMQKPGSIFLIYKKDKIEGCVNLQVHDKKIYLGMLSVSPLMQGSGIGKKLLYAAEDYASANNCSSIYMTVIDARLELIDWYKRHGYTDTGIKEPFEEDAISGRHLQKLQFMVLEKNVSR